MLDQYLRAYHQYTSRAMQVWGCWPTLEVIMARLLLVDTYHALPLNSH